MSGISGAFGSPNPALVDQKDHKTRDSGKTAKQRETVTSAGGAAIGSTATAAAGTAPASLEGRVAKPEKETALTVRIGERGAETALVIKFRDTSLDRHSPEVAHRITTLVDFLSTLFPELNLDTLGGLSIHDLTNLTRMILLLKPPVKDTQNVIILFGKDKSIMVSFLSDESHEKNDADALHSTYMKYWTSIGLPLDPTKIEHTKSYIRAIVDLEQHPERKTTSLTNAPSSLARHRNLVQLGQHVTRLSLLSLQPVWEAQFKKLQVYIEFTKKCCKQSTSSASNVNVVDLLHPLMACLTKTEASFERRFARMIDNVPEERELMNIESRGVRKVERSALCMDIRRRDLTDVVQTAQSELFFIEMTSCYMQGFDGATPRAQTALRQVVALQNQAISRFYTNLGTFIASALEKENLILKKTVSIQTVGEICRIIAIHIEQQLPEIFKLHPTSRNETLKKDLLEIMPTFFSQLDQSFEQYIKELEPLFDFLICNKNQKMAQIIGMISNTLHWVADSLEASKKEEQHPLSGILDGVAKLLSQESEKAIKQDYETHLKEKAQDIDVAMKKMERPNEKLAGAGNVTFEQFLIQRQAELSDQLQAILISIKMFTETFHLFVNAISKEERVLSKLAIAATRSEKTFELPPPLEESDALKLLLQEEDRKALQKASKHAKAEAAVKEKRQLKARALRRAQKAASQPKRPILRIRMQPFNYIPETVAADPKTKVLLKSPEACALQSLRNHWELHFSADKLRKKKELTNSDLATLQYLQNLDGVIAVTEMYRSCENPALERILQFLLLRWCQRAFTQGLLIKTTNQPESSIGLMYPQIIPKELLGNDETYFHWPWFLSPREQQALPYSLQFMRETNPEKMQALTKEFKAGFTAWIDQFIQSQILIAQTRCEKDDLKKLEGLKKIKSADWPALNAVKQAQPVETTFAKELATLGHYEAMLNRTGDAKKDLTLASTLLHLTYFKDALGVLDHCPQQVNMFANYEILFSTARDYALCIAQGIVDHSKDKGASPSFEQLCQEYPLSKEDKALLMEMDHWKTEELYQRCCDEQSEVLPPVLRALTGFYERSALAVFLGNGAKKAGEGKDMDYDSLRIDLVKRARSFVNLVLAITKTHLTKTMVRKNANAPQTAAAGTSPDAKTKK